MTIFKMYIFWCQWKFHDSGWREFYNIAFYSYRKFLSYWGVTYSWHFSVGWILSCINERQKRTSVLIWFQKISEEKLTSIAGKVQKSTTVELPEVSRKTSSPSDVIFLHYLSSFNWELYSYSWGERGEPH